MFNILVVDDQVTNLKILKILLEKEGYSVATAISAKEAFVEIEKQEKGFFALILTDINMPEINGFEFCETIKNKEPYKEKINDAPVIFISALTDVNNIAQGFEKGAVDYITKPFNAKEVSLRVKTHIQIMDLQHQLQEYNKNLERKVDESVKQVTKMQMSTIFSLAKLAQSRDDDTGKHLERVQSFCKILAEELAKSEKYRKIVTPKYIEDIFQSSPLHDIGKVGISDLVLLKPGKLTDEEFEIMKTHTTIGAKTLEEVNKKFGGNSFIEMGTLIAHYHHERWDGRGYPDRLREEEIPLCARIMSIADVYDALKSKRVYKEPFEQEKCVQIIKEGSGTQFDPNIVEAFLKVADKFQEEAKRLENIEIFN
jgi:putative two-component system response regulator